MNHDYLIILNRRWCRNCNTFQTFRQGRWRDAFPPQPWPGYEVTEPICPGLSLAQHRPSDPRSRELAI
jgi:hypothetical protein